MAVQHGPGEVTLAPPSFRVSEWLLLSLLLAVLLGVVFRFAFQTRFALLFGDPIDGLIETSLLEHWWNVMRGLSGWDRTFYFYPAAGTLGYNDGYFLFGVIYSVFRALGLDPFLSAELVDVVVRAAGFVGFAGFARQVLRLPGWAAALGAAAFTVSNNTYYQGGHAQLLCVALAPIEGWLLAALAAAVARGLRRRTAAAGIAAALLLAAWFLTSFYTAWFFVLFSAFWLPLLAVWSGRDRCRRFLHGCRLCWLPLLTCVVTLAAGLLPTARLYRAVLDQVGGHSFAETEGYLLSLRGLVNLGPGNLVWGWLEHWIWPLPTIGELATGFTPLLLCAFLAGLAVATRQRRALPASLGVTAVLCWLLGARLGAWPAWRLVYHYVPAATAIRVVSRLQLFLNWPLISVAMAALAALPASRVSRALGIGLALLVVVEQVNLTRIPALDRPAELAMLTRIAPPPANCLVFFATGTASPDPGYGPDLRGMVQHGIDAMLIAEWLHIPTLNGYASRLPQGWGLLNADRLDYRDRVHAYAVVHGLLPGLCGLDLPTGKWQDHPFAG